jgi:hypothetical protein
MTTYFGAKVGFYMSFLILATKLLIIPAIFGTYVWFYVEQRQNERTVFKSLYAIFLGAWASYFIMIWK